jgi:hypothetical protein
MTRLLVVLLGLILVAGIFGCGSNEEAGEPAESTDAAGEVAVDEQKMEPGLIAVQHILVAFEGSLPGRSISRSREEAETLAKEVYDKAASGADFDVLVKEHTDDAYPGIYKMANFNGQPDMAQQIYPRARMVPAFGNVGFKLEVGEIGLAEFDPKTSPYGWHIIKRVE